MSNSQHFSHQTGVGGLFTAGKPDKQSDLLAPNPNVHYVPEPAPGGYYDDDVREVETSSNAVAVVMGPSSSGDGEKSESSVLYSKTTSTSSYGTTKKLNQVVVFERARSVSGVLK